jgi:hypothetical protein
VTIVQPTASQRRLLERLAAGDVIRLPPWSRRIQVIAVNRQTGSVPSPTFRALLRHGWIERTSGPADQEPTFRLSDLGRRLLDPAELQRPHPPETAAANTGPTV